MTIRKFYTFRVNDSTPEDHTGRPGEITYRDGFLYYHDGATPGGEIIGGGGSGGGPTSWSSITGKPTFAAVATSGSYTDLTNKPDLFSGDYDALTNKPNLFSGAYEDLTGKPTIPSLDGYATEAWVQEQGFGSGGGSSNTGDITFNAATMSAPDETTISIEAVDNNIARARLVLNPNDRIAKLESSFGDDRTFYAGDWAAGNWTLQNGSPVLFFTGATNLYNGLNAINGENQRFSWNDGETVPFSGWGYNGNGDLTIYLDGTSMPPTDPTEITSLMVRWDYVSKIAVDSYEDEEVQIHGRGINVDIDSTRDVRITAGDDLRLEANDTFSLTNNSDTESIEIRTNNSLSSKTWEFKVDGNLRLPSGGRIIDTNDVNILGDVTFDGVKIIGAGTASGDGVGYSTLELVPDNNLYGNNQYLIIDPTQPNHIHIRAGGTQDSSNAQLYLGGETSHFSVGSGSNPTLYLKANDNQWTFGTDGVLTLPAGGGINDSNGNSVLGGGGTTLPADASGYLNNDGSGTLTWVPGNPSGSGMLPYNSVTVLSNTSVGDWTEFTLSGTMDAFYDWNNTYTTITLSSQTAYGKEITVNTKNLWINDSKINSNDYLVIAFPATPAVGDVFSVPLVNILNTVNAGSFVVGETYTISSVGTTNWTSIGASYSGVGQAFVATGIGTGTGTATTTAGAKKVIFKPATGQRAQTMAQGQLGPVVFGQGGTYDFMYVDLAGMNSGNPITWVYAGVIGGVPTWYQFYF